MLLSLIPNRDLKPDNVLVTDLFRAKIADFGASRSMSSADAMAATIAGTPLFAAPEIMRGEEYGASCDIYSFGMMLLDMASSDGLLLFLRQRWRTAQLDSGAESSNIQRTKQAQSDFDERQAMAMMRDIWRGTFRPVVLGGPLVPNAPPSVSSLIIRCTQHDPIARPTFIEVLTVLSNACAQEAEALTYIRGVDSTSRGAEIEPASSQETIAVVNPASSAASRASSSLHAYGNQESTKKVSTSRGLVTGTHLEDAQLRRSSASQSNLLLRSQVYRASVNPLSKGANVLSGGGTKKFRSSEVESRISFQVTKTECNDV